MTNPLVSDPQHTKGISNQLYNVKFFSIYNLVEGSSGGKI